MSVLLISGIGAKIGIFEFISPKDRIFSPKCFLPIEVSWHVGQTIPYAGRVFTEDEVQAAVASTLDFWLTLGSEGEAFQNELASFLGVRHSLLVNSGSSANLVALTALTSAKLPEPRRIKPGDEVITVINSSIEVLWW